MTELGRHQGKRIRLLLLEDNPADMTLVEAYLSQIDDFEFDMHWVTTIQAARELLDESADDFDVVLTDYNLPDGKGLDLVNETSGRILAPMILLTARDDRELDVTALASGAADFLPKNIIDAKILDRTIRYAIERRRRNQNLRINVTQLEATNRDLSDNSARRDAETANIIKLAEHLARPPDDLEFNCHVVGGDQSGYDAVLEACTVGVWHVRADGVSIHTNPHMRRMLGLDPQSTPEDLQFLQQFAERDQRRAEREMDVWMSGMASSFESRFAIRGAGEPRDLAISGCPVLNDAGDVDLIVITVADITERRHAETIIRDLAQKDPLTSLLNRTTFLELLPSAFAINQRNGTNVGILYIDLDNFKYVNDTYGHQAGDEVLRLVAEKIQSCIRESDFAARIGGDEFTVALNNISSPIGAAAVAQNILDAIRGSWAAIGDEVEIELSIGIAMNEDSSPEQCLKNADLALYRCKRDGGNRYEFFDSVMLEFVEQRRRCETDLAQAIRLDEFRLHYQPQINLFDGSTTGMEALLRWQRPLSGLVGPAEFMDVAEECGAIIEIGNWVARAACAHLSMVPSGVPISINISARELRQADLPQKLREIVDAANISSDRLIVEITESAIIDDLEQSAQIVRAIRKQGIKVALDDFGTGYSSLSILKQISVDSIKIDGSFVQNICENAVEAAIAETIVDLGRRMDLRVVAECIETREQARCLMDMGCEEAQGFYFSKPLPVEDAVGWLGQESNRAIA